MAWQYRGYDPPCKPASKAGLFIRGIATPSVGVIRFSIPGLVPSVAEFSFQIACQPWANPTS